ncbi:MAG: MoaD/ThiS family protein [Bacteroidia bacterium]|nr:MoaD/ThiS family protein [Bacteroidia bacterium]
MPRIHFTSALSRFFPGLAEESCKGLTVREVVDEIEIKYPGIKDFILDEEGKLRKHVNIFVGEKVIHDRDKLSDSLSTDSEVLIFQALSGG